MKASHTNQATIETTTLAQENRGICGSRNNCRYMGNSAVYVVVVLDANNAEARLGFNRKWAARALADWISAGRWDGRGDLELCWTGDWEHGQKTRAEWLVGLNRYLDTTNVRIVT